MAEGELNTPHSLASSDQSEQDRVAGNPHSDDTISAPDALPRRRDRSDKRHRDTNLVVLGVQHANFEVRYYERSKPEVLYYLRPLAERIAVPPPPKRVVSPTIIVLQPAGAKPGNITTEGEEAPKPRTNLSEKPGHGKLISHTGGNEGAQGSLIAYGEQSEHDTVRDEGLSLELAFQNSHTFPPFNGHEVPSELHQEIAPSTHDTNSPSLEDLISPTISTNAPGVWTEARADKNSTRSSSFIGQELLPAGTEAATNTRDAITHTSAKSSKRRRAILRRVFSCCFRPSQE